MRKQHYKLLKSVVFIISWKTLPLINKQTRFIVLVTHRLCTLLSQNVSREQAISSFCHELLIQEHRVAATCKAKI